MLTNDLLELYADQWLGAVDGAREHGSDLICFCGGALEARGHLKSANAIYDLVGPQSLDGLVVWSSTLGIVVGSERLEAFCRRFAPLPIVSVERAQRLGGRFTVDSSPAGSTTVRVELPNIMRGRPTPAHPVRLRDSDPTWLTLVRTFGPG